MLADEDFLAGDWRLAVAHAQGFEGTRTLQRTSQTFGFSDFDRDFGSQVFDQAFHLPFLYSVCVRSSFATKLSLHLSELFLFSLNCGSRLQKNVIFVEH